MGHSNLRTIAFISSISSIVQGVIWFILSLLAIITYNCNLPLYGDPPYTYRDYAVSYFQGTDCRFAHKYIRDKIEECAEDLTSSGSLVGWASVIFTVNILLVIVSSALLTAMALSQKKLFILFLYMHIFLNIFTIVLDVGITSVVSTDYAVLDKSHCSGNIDSKISSITLLTVDIIVSKGVILWVANICLTIYMCCAAPRQTGCMCEWDITYDENSESENDLSNTSSIENIRNKHRDNLNKPIEVIYRDGSPEHSAKARWPILALSAQINQDSRFNEIPRNSQMPKQHISAPISRHESRGGAGERPDLMQVNPIAQDDKVKIVSVENKNTRPLSLEEAIKTMRPLRHVKNSPYRN